MRRAPALAIPLAALLALATARAEGAGESAFETLAAGVATSLRGVSVLDARVAWVSGSNGRVGVTADGGATWRWLVVPGHERRDFRDVEARSAESALVVAVGSPGLVLATTDGGRTWGERLRDERPGIFFDALAAAGADVLVAGDPLDGRFVLYRSLDGGSRFDPLAGPAALAGEAAFAASGSALAIGADGAWALGTGGAAARVHVSADRGASWRAATAPLAAGAASRGVFSLATPAPGVWVAVGGDYRDEPEGAATAARSTDGGATFAAAAPPPGGYRSAVLALDAATLLATGPSGTDLSLDGGRGWRPLAGEGFHALAGSPDGGTVLAAGAGGRVSRLRRDALPRR